MTTETTKKSRLDENNSPLSSQNNWTNTPISDKINTIRTRISDVYRKNFQKMVNTEKEILTEKEEFEKIQTFQNDFEKFETQLFYNFWIFVRVDNENKIILSEGLEKIPDKIIENNEEYQQILRQIQDFQKQAQQITEETGVPHGDSLPDFLSSKSIAYALKHNKKIFLSSIGLETFSEILQKNPQFLEYKDTIEKAYGVSFNEEMLDFLASKNQDFLFDYYDVFNINKDQKDKIFEFFQGKNIYEQMRIIERFWKKFWIISQEYAKPLITEKQWFTLLENNFEDYNLSDVESQELIEYCTDKSFLSKRYFSKNFLKKLSNKDIAVFIGKEISDEYVNILLEWKTQEEINQIIQEVYLNTSSIEKALILASHYNTKLQLKLNKKDYFYEKKFLHLFPDEDIYAILLSDASYYQRAEDGQIIELQREFTQEQLDFIKNTIISALLIGFTLTASSYATTPVAQQAYYDTFSFKVNGIVQYISDVTKKPFIANSRVYVPISTLSDLGIASVQWIPSNSGMPAELRITPAQSISEDKTAYYEQKLNELATQIAQKDVKIKELEASVKTLTDENTTLKNNSTPSSDDRDVRRQVSDLEYDVNRDRDFNRIDINGKTFDVSYTFSYRRDFDVSVYIKGLSTADLDDLKSSSSRSSRNLEYLVTDVSKEILRNSTFKNVDIYFNVCDSSNSNKVFATFDYKDSRLRGGISR